MGTMTIEQLRESGGTSDHRGRGGYDEARKVYNAMIDRRRSPSCRANAGDVMATATSPRMAGHRRARRLAQRPGFGVRDDGVAQICPLRGLGVDPSARTARAEGGVTGVTSMPRRTRLASSLTGGIILTNCVGGLTPGGVSAI
jgi:hypothetical protein